MIKKIGLIVIAGTIAHGSTGGSLNLSASTGGLGIGGIYTGNSRFGVFGHIGSVTRKDSDIPPDADFSWVNYNNKDWKSKDFFFGGPAFRVNKNFTVGIGYSSFSKKMYEYGNSTVTGITFSRGAGTETNNGIVAMVEFGQTNGFGAQLFAAPGLIGGGVSLRLNR